MFLTDALEQLDPHHVDRLALRWAAHGPGRGGHATLDAARGALAGQDGAADRLAELLRCATADDTTPWWAAGRWVADRLEQPAARPAAERVTWVARAAGLSPLAAWDDLLHAAGVTDGQVRHTAARLAADWDGTLAELIAAAEFVAGDHVARSAP